MTWNLVQERRAASLKSQHQLKVEQTMHYAGQNPLLIPSEPSIEVRKLRAKLILEEALETVEALGVNLYLLRQGGIRIIGGDQIHYSPEGEFNLVEVVDGCCDIRVVTTGTLSACGVPDLPVQEEVDNNNLTKFPDGKPILREDGKYLKPEGYKPPNIAGVLLKVQSQIQDGERIKPDIRTFATLPLKEWKELPGILVKIPEKHGIKTAEDFYKAASDNLAKSMDKQFIEGPEVNRCEVGIVIPDQRLAERGDGQLDISEKYLIHDCEIDHHLPLGKYLVLQLDDPDANRRHVHWRLAREFGKLIWPSEADRQYANKISQMLIQVMENEPKLKEEKAKSKHGKHYDEATGDSI